jgi:hypothetical protein
MAPTRPSVRSASDCTDSRNSNGEVKIVMLRKLCAMAASSVEPLARASVSGQPNAAYSAIAMALAQNDRPCAPANMPRASSSLAAPSRRPSRLAMPFEIIVASATISIESGNTMVTAVSASGPTKAPRNIASTTVSRPLTLVSRMIGSAVRAKVRGMESPV